MINQIFDLSLALEEEHSDFLYLETKKSAIPNSGNGLFAKKPIQKGDLIA